MSYNGYWILILFHLSVRSSPLTSATQTTFQQFYPLQLEDLTSADCHLPMASSQKKGRVETRLSHRAASRLSQ